MQILSQKPQTEPSRNRTRRSVVPSRAVEGKVSKISYRLGPTNNNPSSMAAAAMLFQRLEACLSTRTGKPARGVADRNDTTGQLEPDAGLLFIRFIDQLAWTPGQIGEHVRKGEARAAMLALDWGDTFEHLAKAGDSFGRRRDSLYTQECRFARSEAGQRPNRLRIEISAKTPHISVTAST